MVFSDGISRSRFEDGNNYAREENPTVLDCRNIMMRNQIDDNVDNNSTTVVDNDPGKCVEVLRVRLVGGEWVEDHRYERYLHNDIGWKVNRIEEDCTPSNDNKYPKVGDNVD